MREKIKKGIQIAFSGILSVCIAFPVVTMNHQKNFASQIDNTMLPEWNSAEFKPADIDNYIDKRIGLRKEAIDANTVVYDKLFGELEHPTYYYGQDGYVFFQNLVGEIYAPDTEHLSAFARYLRKVQDYCAERNVPFIYCINPSKSTVYHEYLPKGYVYDNRFLKTLQSELTKNGVNWISNAEVLEEKAKTEQVYNVAFDPGHWNDLGQFYGNNHLLSAVSQYFPAVKALTFDDFDIKDVIYKTNEGTYYETQETAKAFYRKEMQVEDITGAYEGIVLHENFRGFACFKNTGDITGLPRTLFFHGSYYNRNRDFYKDRFAEAYSVHNYQNLLNFEYYFNIFQPECVLLESAEYATANYYFPFGKLRDKEFNSLFTNVKDEEHYTKNLSQCEYERIESERLVTLQIPIDKQYSYGYLETDTTVLDLWINENMLSVSYDKTFVDITNAKLHLY